MSVGLLEGESAEVVHQTLDPAGNITHACGHEHELFIGQNEAKILLKFDPVQLQELKSAGVQEEKLTIEDLETVGQYIDEIEAQLNYSIDHTHQFLYKHAIALRKTAGLISIRGCYFESRNQICASVFGHSLHIY